MKAGWLKVAAALAAVIVSVGCNEVDDERIPAMPVSINLGDAGLWNSYGVHGFGNWRVFVPQDGEPAGFHYTATTATGFGGVLLISGMDPFSGDTDVPLAYDLACPVERNPRVRVMVVSDERYEAVCPECGSRYDVTMRGGSPVGGEAATGKYKLGLKRYTCLKTTQGGYTVVR